MSFQVLVIILIYGGFSFHDCSHFIFNLIQFYKEIFNFCVKILTLDNAHLCNKVWGLTLESCANHWLLILFFVFY